MVFKPHKVMKSGVFLPLRCYQGLKGMLQRSLGSFPEIHIKLLRGHIVIHLTFTHEFLQESELSACVKGSFHGFQPVGVLLGMCP